MARGRCAGCGLEDLSSKKVERHMTQCTEYLELWKVNPALAVTAEQAMIERTALVATDEFQDAKLEAKDERFAGYRANNERRIESQASRWKSQQFTSGHGVATPLPTPSYGRLGLTSTHLDEGNKSDDAARRVAYTQADVRVG